jgi:hypothetical protein
MWGELHPNTSPRLRTTLKAASVRHPQKQYPSGISHDAWLRIDLKDCQATDIITGF